MANWNEQVLIRWAEWEEETGDDSGDPAEFIEWATTNKKLSIPPQDVRAALRKRITAALRQAQRINDNGIPYRAKQCVMLFDEKSGTQIRRWFDTDTGGTANLRQKAVRQRRDAIANDVYRAMCDVEHMNGKFSEDPQLEFVLEFREDYEERKAAAALGFDKEEDEAA